MFYFSMKSERQQVFLDPEVSVSILLTIGIGHLHVHKFFSSLTRSWSSWIELQNTQITSLQRGKNLPKSVLEMTLNNLMVKFQQCWNFRECGLLLHWVVAPDKCPIDGLNRTKPWFQFTFFLHLNCVFMLNWFARNRTVLTFKLYLC